MAWVKVAGLAALGDVSAANLVNDGTTRTAQAISDRFGPMVAEQIAKDDTIKQAAVEAMNDEGVRQKLAFDKGTLPADADFNTLRTPGIFRVTSTADMSNIPPFTRPSAASGFLFVINITGNTWNAQEFYRYGVNFERWWRVSSDLQGNWTPWVLVRGSKTVRASSLDANLLTTPAVYTIETEDDVKAAKNLPVQDYGMLEHFRDGQGVVSQRFSGYRGNLGVWIRSSSSVVSGTFRPWMKLGEGGGGGGAGSDAALTNALLREDWSRRLGGVRKVKTGCVAFRFDHGLKNLDEIVRPIMEEFSIPYAVVMNSAQARWDLPESEGVTPAMVNDWVKGGLAEVWNHGKTHKGATAQADWVAEILGGRDELRSKIPAAQIDGFIIPGTDNVGYGDFKSGKNITEFYSTPAGRFLLETHAVSSGYIPGTGRRILDGVTRQGQLHIGLDESTVSAARTQIDLAISERSGLQFMLHPSQLDLEGKITSANFRQVVEYVVSKRDAGTLTVLSPYQILLADSRE